MTFGFLFDKQKEIIDHFTSTNPTQNDYKEKLEFFALLEDGLKSQSHIDLGCIRLNYSEYNDKLLEQCVFWYFTYGKQLILECNNIMTSFSERISVNGN